jgi:hypothetical protein
VRRRTLKWGIVTLMVVVFWVGTVLAAIVVAKSRVPVNLPVWDSVSALGDSHAVAKGTWVIESQQQAFPLQTTDIQCEKELRRCTMATATVMSGDQLNLNVDFYEVISWDKSRIVFVNETPLCVRYIYTIDLATKATNAIRSKRASKGADCAAIDQELRLSLKNGFHEGLKLQEEAMPWFGKLALAPLRLFQ